MPGNRKITFATITTKGALFPVDFLERLASGDRVLDGLTPEAYHLNENEKLNEVISRSWKNVLGYWKNFQAAKSKLSATDKGTSETREKWLLPLFKELGYGRLLTSEKYQFDGKDYPVSHTWNKSPIHLISFKAPLDDKSDIIGARKTSPHAMMQDLLNRSTEQLWAFLSNGHQVRILRDNRSLTKQAYIEFDLETMLDSEVYSDFVVFWLLCHQSRVEEEIPEQCWLETWTRTSREQGIRALDSMRKSVENAIESLGIGFIENKYNSELRSKLRDGKLSVQDYYRQLLRIVYRFLFLFTAEDRDLLHAPGASLEAKEIFIKYYSTSRLREIAQQSRGASHTDLWELLRFISEKLGADEGCKELALPAWGGFLWKKEIVADLIDCKITNRSLLNSIRSLAFTIDEQIFRAVDYKNLGAEELGSVYESLLELNPKISLDPPSFALETLAGSERKTTGSYYTPDSLVQSLLETALEPVLEEALKNKNPEQAILRLKFCDPAMGSGHFLIAAAHRTAKKLAAIRTGEDEPSPNALQHALRDVISNCIYGVDINPMAVELCKFSLWLEALEPGMPLSFIDHHIKWGNSLLGTTPALMRDGIPNDAFKPIEGDDKDYCSEWRKVNKRERETQTEDLFRYAEEPWRNLGNLAINLIQIIDIPNDSIENIHKKEKKYAELVNSQGYEFGKLLADAWCASFAWKKTKEFDYPITEEVFRKAEKTPYSIPKWMKDEIKRLSQQYQFFHWFLEFPDIFQVLTQSHNVDEKLFNEQNGWLGGFDVLLGNPPWEKINFEDKEFFVIWNREIFEVETKAKRQELIKALKHNNPQLFNQYIFEKRKHDFQSSFFRYSGLFPLTGISRVNLFSVFAELSFNLINKHGYIGILVPTGIITDDNNKVFFSTLLKGQNISSAYDLENRESLFPSVDSRYKFCLLTLSNARHKSRFAFYLGNINQIKEEERIIELTYEEVHNINPNTLSCPIFRNKKDSEIAKNIYNHTPILFYESGINKTDWVIEIKTPFNISNDSIFFKKYETKDENDVALFESKMIHQFDHRYGNYYFNNSDLDDIMLVDMQSHADVHFENNPKYWLPKTLLEDRYGNGNWFLVYRMITNSTNERTLISSIIPKVAASHSMSLIAVQPIHKATILLSNLNTFLIDYISRLSVTGMNYSHWIFKQLPIIPYSIYKKMEIKFINDRVLELSFTSYSLRNFAIDYGYNGSPFIWDLERRFIMRCELDALYFHLYEIERDDVDYIMETFPIVKRKDEEKFGEYRTKKLILEIYDEMVDCKKNGTQYQTKLDPPPADPRVGHRE